MNKHKIEVLDVREKNQTTHECEIRIDDIPMTCKSVAVFPPKATDITFRLSFSKPVKKHPDYREIRKELIRILAKVHGMELPPT